MYKILEDKIIYIVNNEVKGVLEFEIKDGVADIFHTFVDEDLRGKGIAGELVKKAFEYFEKMDYKVVCSCSYAKKWCLKNKKCK